MTWVEDKIAKWGKSIAARAGAAAAERVLEGHAALAEASTAARAAWTAGVMARLAEAVPAEGERAAVMAERACVFIEEFGTPPLDKLRALFRETGDVDAVIAAMAADPARHGRSRREGDVIYETKAPADAEPFESARTPYDKQVAGCYCPLARAARPPVPHPYCFCGGGWYQGIWEYILERPVRIEVAASLMLGDDACVFRVYLPAGFDGAAPASPPASITNQDGR